MEEASLKTERGTETGIFSGDHKWWRLTYRKLIIVKNQGLARQQIWSSGGGIELGSVIQFSYEMSHYSVPCFCLCY